MAGPLKKDPIIAGCDNYKSFHIHVELYWFPHSFIPYIKIYHLDLSYRLLSGVYIEINFPQTNTEPGEGVDSRINQVKKQPSNLFKAYFN